MRALNLTVWTVFYIEITVDQTHLPVALGILRIQHLSQFFDDSVRIWLHVDLRCRNYGLDADCECSFRIRVTGGCVRLLKLFQSIVNRFPTQLEMSHNSLIGDASSLEGVILVNLYLVS